MIIDALSWVLLVLGGFFILVGGIGMIRMPDLYTRMHACSVTETMGPLLVIAGLMLQSGWALPTFKLFAIFLFLMFTGPVASYAVVNSALIDGVQPRLDADLQQDLTKQEPKA